MIFPHPLLVLSVLILQLSGCSYLPKKLDYFHIVDLNIRISLGCLYVQYYIFENILFKYNLTHFLLIQIKIFC